MKIELRLFLALGSNDDGEVKMVDYFFQNDQFSGVTGSLFHFVSPDEIVERNELENVIESFGYIWHEAVAENITIDSQDDYIQSCIDGYLMNSDGLFISHDTSHLLALKSDDEFLKYTENNFTEKKVDNLFNPEVGTFECTGGGRCFDAKENELNSYINPKRKAIHLIAKEFEAGKIKIDEVEKFLIENEIPFKKVEK